MEHKSATLLPEFITMVIFTKKYEDLLYGNLRFLSNATMRH